MKPSSTQPTAKPDQAGSSGETVELKIDGKPVTVKPGATVLEAARDLGIELPTLCHKQGLAPFTSCMMCTVVDKKSGKSFASCSIPATAGMDIETESEQLSDYRRTMLELLLSEHLGDCEAPCEVVCPASMPIPELIRLLRAGETAEAVALMRSQIPLGGVLERICTAPCEKGCRRAQVDTGVAIQNVCRYIADLTEKEHKNEPPKETMSGPDLGKKVGIIGAGPAGLATAFFLSKAGVHCTVIDDHEKPGGMLRGGAIPLRKLNDEILDIEMECLLNDRITLEMGKRIGRDIDFQEWREQFDAVVLTIGQISEPDEELPKSIKTRAPHPSPTPPTEVDDIFGVKMKAGNIQVDRATGMTSVKGVFAGGDAARFHRMAVRAIGDARGMAASVYKFLTSEAIPREDPEFNCTMGKLAKDEMDDMLHRCSDRPRLHFEQGPLEPLPEDEILKEAERCMACDCAARHDCDLRVYSDEYGAKQSRFKPAERPPWEEDMTHPMLVHEVGKCIRCSLCIRLSVAKEEPIGLAAIGRGSGKRPGPPNGSTWADALTISPEEYAENCPTGAISLHRKTVRK